jgi:hypothetical protein
MDKLESRTLLAGAPAQFRLLAADDSGRFNSDGVTNLTTVRVVGVADAGSTVRVYRAGVVLDTLLAPGGTFQSTLTFDPGDTTFVLQATAQLPGDVVESSPSDPLTLRIDTLAPSTPAVPDLTSASDRGQFNSDNITSDNTPSFSVPAASDLVDLFANNVPVATYASPGTITIGPLADGSYDIAARRVDLAGNTSAITSALPVVIDTLAPAAPSGAPSLLASSDSGQFSNDRITSDSTPTFSAVAPELVRLIDNATFSVLADYASPSNITSGGLSDGNRTVFLRSIDVAGNVSGGFSPSLALTIDTIAPANPTAAPDLLAASDTGVSNTDNLTRLTTLDIAPVTTGLHRMFRDGILIADYSTANPLNTTVPGGGAYSFTLRSLDLAGNVSAGVSPALVVTVDTIAPSLDATPQFLFAITPNAVRFDFSESVTALSNAGQFVFTAPPAVTLGSPTLAVNNATGLASLTFPSQSNLGIAGVLPDGNYTVTLAGVTDQAGNPLAATDPFSFFSLPGDFDRDRTVGFSDLLILAQNYNLLTGATYATGDATYDGAVSFDDLLALAARYNTTLPAGTGVHSAAGTPQARRRHRAQFASLI